MKQLLCRVLGHQRTLMAFTSNRFSCQRCGADLGRDVPTPPTPPAALRTHPTLRAADPSRDSPWEQLRPFRPDTSRLNRLQARPRRRRVT